MNNENTECFICFENNKINKIISLNTQNIYIKKCNCNAYIHYVCLKKWYDINNNCPICRNIITEKKEYYIFFNIKIFLIIIKLFYYFYFIYFLYNIYFIYIEINKNINVKKIYY